VPNGRRENALMLFTEKDYFNVTYIPMLGPIETLALFVYWGDALLFANAKIKQDGKSKNETNPHLRG